MQLGRVSDHATPIMLANPTGATSLPGPGKAENSRPKRSKVG
jgi:putative transposase